MPFKSESEATYHGLYRNTLENIMFNSAEKEKGQFQDETLTQIKKVSKLVKKFEQGNLDETVENISLGGENQNQENISRRSPIDNEDRREGRGESADNGLEETPILGTCSPVQSDCTDSRTFVVESKIVEDNANSISTTDSSENYTNAAPMDTTNFASNYSQAQQFYQFNNFNGSKFARAQVHQKFTEYFKWEPEMLHSVAATAAQLRFETLSNLPHTENMLRIEILKQMYRKCTERANKEMDALCCTLVFLMDNVSDVHLSIHEEYIADKYAKRHQ